MNSSKKLLKNSFIYTVSNMILKAFNFFLIPLYTNYLTTEDYGIVSIANGFSSTLIYLITLSLSSAVFRFYADIKNDKEKVERYFGTIVTFCFITNFIFLLLAFLLKDATSKIFFTSIDFFPIVMLALINTSGISLYNMYQDILKSAQFAKKSACTSIIYFLVQLAMCIIFVVFMKKGASGALLAYTVTQIAFVLWSLRDLKKMHMFRVCLDIDILKESLRYSIPFIPHNISTQIAQYISKLFIGSSQSLSTAGLYNLALQFGMTADTIQSSVNSAFQPWFFEQLNDENNSMKEHILSIASLLTWAFCFIFILIGFFSKEAIYIMARRSYYMAWKVVPLIVANFMIKIPYYFYVSVLYYYKQASKKVFSITVSASLLNILLSYIFIPVLGMYGSVIADILSMIVRVLLIVVTAHKYGNISFGLKAMTGKILYTMIVLVIFLLPLYLELNIVFGMQILIKATGVFVFVLGMLLIERKNLPMLRNELKKAIKKIRN